MLVLQDCIEKLSAFKREFGRQYGITKLGIFGSVARQENTEDSDIDIVVEVEKPTLSLMYELKRAQWGQAPLRPFALRMIFSPIPVRRDNCLILAPNSLEACKISLRRSLV